jgi:hypothetical protein
MAKYEVDQQVRVSDINGRRSASYPPGGWTGIVTKVGRKLVTVRFQSREQVFRIETGQANDQYGHQCISTLEEAEQYLRYSRAREALKETDFEVRLGRSPSVEMLEGVVAFLLAGR